VAHPELGTKILDAVLEQLGPVARIDTSARLEGRSMTMVLSPERKPPQRKPQASAAPEAAPSAPSSPSTPTTRQET
jgi:translation initiation factor IF-3